MHSDAGAALAAVAAADGDVHKPGGALAHLERVGGAVVAEEGVVAEGENRRPPASFRREQSVADCEDAVVEPMQASREHAGMDRLAREADAAELIARDRAALRGGKTGDLDIRGGYVKHAGT